MQYEADVFIRWTGVIIILKANPAVTALAA